MSVILLTGLKKFQSLDIGLPYEYTVGNGESTLTQPFNRYKILFWLDRNF